MQDCFPSKSNQPKGEEGECFRAIQDTYSPATDVYKVSSERTFHSSGYSTATDDLLSSQFCSHLYNWSARHSVGLHQPPWPVCGTSLSIDTMLWEPLKLNGSQDRFRIGELPEMNGFLSLCPASRVTVHHPTPIYLPRVTLRLQDEEWTRDAHITANKRGDVSLKGKMDEKRVGQDVIHESGIEKEHLKDIGSGRLSAFSSIRKKTDQNSRYKTRTNDHQIEVQDEDISKRNETIPGFPSLPKVQERYALTENEDAQVLFGGKPKLEVMAFQSIREFDSEKYPAARNSLAQNDVSFRLCGVNNSLITDHQILFPESFNGRSTRTEYRSLTTQAKDDATVVPSAADRYLGFNQDPSSTMSPLSLRQKHSLGSIAPQKYKHNCDECGRSFARSSTLVTHKRIHSGEKPFSCETCGRAFRQPGNLSRHRLTHTTSKPYVCSYCNKAFNRVSNLHTHMRTHNDYKPYACNFCDKRFRQKVDVKIHRYTHTGEKPHKCFKCGRRFKQLTHLKYHLRTHSDVFLYHCEFCGKGFNQKGNLKSHRYTHTGERPFKCSECGKGFTLASTRNTHLRTHAEKPFKCQYCDKTFYQKNALKTHVTATHPYTGGVLIL